MNGKKRFISLKAKIMLSTLILVVFSFALVSYVIFSLLSNSLRDTAKAEFLQISQKYTYNFENEINNAMNYLAILSSKLEIDAELGITDRETLQKTILSIFDEYGLLDGSSVYFESNMYDGKDADYIGSEYGTAKSGKICWYFYIDAGKTAYLPEGLENDVEFDLPHYTMAKEANRPIFTDPVAYEIDGKNIPMFTLTYPINDKNGQFIGAVTVDLFLDDIYTQLQNEKIYETGYVVICNSNEQLIYSPRYEDIGKTRADVGLTYPLPTIEEESSFHEGNSIIDDVPTFVEINSVYIPQLDSSFYISVSAPLDEIDAEGLRLMLLLVVFDLFVVAAIALLLYYLIGKISAPLNEITESVDNIANGNYNARIKGTYAGEFAVVKDSVNSMAESIEAYIEEAKNSLRQQSLLTSISQSFLSDTDIETLISSALHKIGEFIGVAQILYYKLDDDGFTFVCQSEWIDPKAGKQSNIGNRQVLTESFLRYIKGLSGEKGYCLNSNDPLLKETMSPYMINFQNYISTPIFLKGNLYGALDFFMEDNDKEWSDSAISMATLVSSLLSGVFERYSMESELITAKEQAEQGSRSKTQFLSRMSHEMRTPMNAIIGMTSIAKKSDDPTKKEYCLDRIDNASRHLLGVINDILDMSKIEANKFELSNSEFNFEQMLHNVLNVVNLRINEKHQNFSLFIDPSMPISLIGDEQHLAQVITNLLTNAVKFTPEAGTIQLRVGVLHEEDGLLTLQIEIVDSGIGISEEQQAKLFRSFEQADGSIARKFGGTGLGLAISKHIVELMEGTIWVESELEKGAKFAFTTKMKKGVNNIQDSFKNRIKVNGLNVMIIDDSPDVLDYFKHVMDEFGVSCTLASSGAEALEIFDSASKPFDIVFVDWNMPRMNGIELTKELKRRPVKHPIIIMISVAEWSDIESEAIEAGVNGFMPKPISPAMLINCINRHLDISAEAEIEETRDSDQITFEGKTALLAEDVDINREILLSVLYDTKLKIECAENGRQAYEMFAANPDRYDMIFMDVHMPEVDGLEATRRIRAMGTPQGMRVPIVAMTADVFNEDINKCLESGMNDHIGKPIDIDALINMIKKYLL